MTIEEGATSGTILIPSIIDDQADEADETIIITLSNPTGAILGSDIVHTAVITDNDNPPEIDFNTTSSSGAESVSSAGLTVDLSTVSNQNVTVDYAVTGTATGSGEDYTLGAGKLTINAGETSGTITIASIIDDPFDEPDETVIITLSNPVNATLGNDNAHTFTIIDNDTTPIINFSAPTSNGDESITSAALTLDLSVAPTQNVTLDFAVTGTATGSGTDYTLADGTLTISAGEKTGTITINDIVDDEFLALDEHSRHTSRENYQNILKNWLKQVCHLDDATDGPLDIRVITALKHTVGKSDMGTDQWKGLARSLQLDILEGSMVSWNDFINYCEGATVSPASIYIYISASSFEPFDGYKYNLKKSPRYYAKNLAIYCYIVHILRDLAKDAKGSMRLITIPDEVLKEVKLTRSSIQKEVISKSKKISNLADLLSEKAKSYQGKGHSEIEELYPVLGNREALALRGLIGCLLYTSPSPRDS